MTKQPHRWVSIDPGSQHVGMAWWDDDHCTECAEYTPLSALEAIEHCRPKMLVVEQFRLYPTHAQTLTGSTMGTSQVIGALAWWAFANDMPMYLQPAAIKIPTRALMKSMKIDMMPGSIHAQDAFLHGVHWLHRGQHLDTPGTIFTGVNQD